MSNKKKALYAGTFDPFTNGHKDIVTRALNVFDEVTILIAVPPSKKPFIAKDTRLKILKEIFKDEPRVIIESWGGLIVDYAKEKNIGSIVRGLRPTGDFEIEFQMASMNRHLNSELDTFFLMTGEDHYYVSSTLVREIHSHGGDISKFVDPIVIECIKEQEKE